MHGFLESPKCCGISRASEIARYLLEIYLFSAGSCLFKFAKGKFTGILKHKNEVHVAISRIQWCRSWAVSNALGHDCFVSKTELTLRNQVQFDGSVQGHT